MVTNQIQVFTIINLLNILVFDTTRYIKWLHWGDSLAPWAFVVLYLPFRTINYQVEMFHTVFLFFLDFNHLKKYLLLIIIGLIDFLTLLFDLFLIDILIIHLEFSPIELNRIEYPIVRLQDFTVTISVQADNKCKSSSMAIRWSTNYLTMELLQYSPRDV